MNRVSPPVLLDRDAECRAVDGVIAAARDGTSGALVVRGEPGIGKTALLDHAAAGSADFRVARIAGVESEQVLGYAALDRLLRPFRTDLHRLPRPQSDALGSALGLAGTGPPDGFLVGLATLTLLAEAAAAQPVLCVVDDVQWLDVESSRVLGFVARRLGADRLAVLFGQRDPSETPLPLDGIPVLDVPALSPAGARRLLEAVVPAPLDGQVVEQVLEQTGGNPMGIVELATELSGQEMLLSAHLERPLPVSARIEERFLREVRTLPEDTRTLLLLAASDQAADPGLLWAAARTLVVTPAALTAAEDRRLLVLGAAIHFRHPLIRSAVYSGASAADRRRAHAALASACDPRRDADRRARHLAASAVDPDEEVAAALDGFAERAQRRGGHAAQAVILARAAELSPDLERRADRRLGAARAALLGGSGLLAAEMLDAVESAEDPSRRSEALRLRAASHNLLGRPALAPALLLAAARESADEDGQVARSILLEAVEAAMVTRGRSVGTTLGEVARAALAAPRPQAGRETLEDLLLDAFATRTGVGFVPAVDLLRRAVTELTAETSEPQGLARWSMLGSLAAQDLWDEDGRHELLVQRAALEREHGALSSLRITLLALADCELIAGNHLTAEAHQQEAHEITVAIGGPVDPFDLAAINVHGWAGHIERTRDLALSVAPLVAEASGIESILVMARSALATAELAAGNYAAALDNARFVYEVDPPGFGNRALAEMVEAGDRSGDDNAAHAALGRLSERAKACNTPLAQGLLARSVAIVGGGDGTEAGYRSALVLIEGTRARTEVARTHLLLGEWLRRDNRRADSRHELRTAHHMFADMGAAGFAERARAELLATGEHPRRRTPDTTSDLTSQELRIALLAADGATNSEIAAQLFLSVKTVEYHLQKVFRKLQVTSRRRIGRALPNQR